MLYLDDDTRLPLTLLRDLGEIATSRPEIDVFGGPNLTPTDAPLFEQIQGLLLAMPLVTGPMSRRYRRLVDPAETNGKGLTLCNLAVRSGSGGRFPEHQCGGEECTMLHALAERGCRMLRHPALTVEHQRRPGLGSWARQMHKYGHGRGEHLARQHPIIAPVGSIAVLVAMGGTRRGRYLLAGAPILVAAAAAAIVTLTERGRGPRCLFTAFTQALTVPASYGGGVLHGLASSAASSRVPRRQACYVEIDHCYHPTVQRRRIE